MQSAHQQAVKGQWHRRPIANSDTNEILVRVHKTYLHVALNGAS